MFSRVATGSGPKAENKGDTTAPAFNAPSVHDVDVRNPGKEQEHDVATRHAERAEDVGEATRGVRQFGKGQASLGAVLAEPQERNLAGERSGGVPLDRLEGDVEPSAAAARPAGGERRPSGSRGTPAPSPRDAGVTRRADRFFVMTAWAHGGGRQGPAQSLHARSRGGFPVDRCQQTGRARDPEHGGEG